jgi:magnesium chelatase subunit D
MTSHPAAAASWADATLAAVVCAVDPAGCGGIALRAGAGPVRDRWLAYLQSLLPAQAPCRRVPVHIHDERLIGGLDLTATLRAGRPVGQSGLLAEAHGGLVIVPGAERLGTLISSRLAAVFESHEVVVERDGIAARAPASFILAALDEGDGADEQPPPALLERLPFMLSLETVALRDVSEPAHTRADVARAQLQLQNVTAPDAIVAALCASALAHGVHSLRPALFAVRAARVIAALDGCDVVTAEHASAAARLVIAARATQLPEASEPEAPPPEPSPEPESPPADQDASTREPEVPLDDLVLAATQAAIPPQLLAQLQVAAAVRERSQGGGRAGVERAGGLRGRPAGVRRGELRRGARLNVVETLRAAAPWQAVRRRLRGETDASRQAHVIDVRRDDFRLTRYRDRARTTTIFAVDASGSAALHRLGEAKGAVELLLGECYVRRDRVALVAFRGKGAEVMLPPTRSLVRAKRNLAGLPGGGGTPLAAGLELAMTLAEHVRRQGDTPVLVILTDGRANVDRDGRADRAVAESQAFAAARRIRAAGYAAVVVDTAPRPQPLAARLADEMSARYLPLPNARPTAINLAVRAAAEH